MLAVSMLGCVLAATSTTVIEPTPAVCNGSPVANASPKDGQANDYDIVVYGGTSGGITAAIQAKKMGKSVVMIEPGRFLGGLTTGGLGATDIGNKAAIGGLSREFYHRVWLHYQKPESWTHEKADFYASKRKQTGEEEMWTFEPHVATNIYHAWLKEHDIPVLMNERLDLKKGVVKNGTMIVSIAMESGKTFTGKMFIDATYEGDLLAKAGCTYHVGREANATYKETLNGVQTKRAKSHQFVKLVDPFVKPGDRSSGVLPGIHNDGPGEEGVGDHRVQAYNFRFCATDVPANRVAWPKPADYDPLRYELLLRNFEAGDHRSPWNPVRMPNRKTDSNNNFAFSTDNLGMNYAYPDADHATREKIVAEHVSYMKGLFWTMANSPRAPEKIRKEFTTWALAKDEFTDNDNWPSQLYVREARRLIGEYVMTEHNCRGTTIIDDSVGMGAYGMDSHNVQRYVTAEGYAINEGDIQVHGFSPYPISYRSIVPKKEHAGNLLVPVCMSATHIAYGSIRMEPVFMALGQSAATAACFAIDGNSSVQEVPYPKLRERLLADKQALEWKGPKVSHAGIVQAASLAGITIDNDQAKLTGDWTHSSANQPRVGADYLHDGNEGKGTKTATFTFKVPSSGKYNVRLSYPQNANRAKNVPVDIHVGDIKISVKVDQQKSPTLDKAFVKLGDFEFTDQMEYKVVITNAGTDGHVIVDALNIVAVPK